MNGFPTQTMPVRLAARALGLAVTLLGAIRQFGKNRMSRLAQRIGRARLIGRVLCLAAILMFVAAHDLAAQFALTWSVTATFADGGTANGTFDYDASTNTVTDFDINVRGGDEGTFPALTFSPPGDTVSVLNLANPEDTFVFIRSSTNRQLRFTPVTALTDAGGTIALDLMTSSGGSGGGDCFNCSPLRLITAGSLSATPPPPIITSVSASPITDTTATITWDTDQLSDSQVIFGTDPLLAVPSMTPVQDTNPLVMSHSVLLFGLTPATTYFYRVKSKNVVATESTSPIFSFETSAGVPPVITGVEVVMGSLTESSASITWMTDVPADSTVFYGTDPGNMNLMVESAALVTTHVVPIAGLTADTLYFFRVESDDGTDPPNTGTSGIFSFQTLAGAVPVITGVEVVMGSLTESSASITWMTDVPADSTVFYGTDPGNMNLMVESAALVITHVVPIAGLTADTLFFFRVESNDGTAEPNTNTSGIFSFETLDVGPVLTITKTHAGNFTQGETSATYTVTVTNDSTTDPTDSTTVTVTDPMPSGLTATGASGTGWTCTGTTFPTTGTVTCTRLDVLASLAAYPTLTISVDVSPTASSPITNTASVVGGGDNTSANGQDVSTVDATPTITHLSPPSVTAGGATFDLTVTGAGYVPTSVVHWNGGGVSTTFNGPTELTRGELFVDCRSRGGSSHGGHSSRHVQSGRAVDCSSPRGPESYDLRLWPW